MCFRGPPAVLHTHGFADDQRQQVAEKRTKLVSWHSGSHQGDSLPGKLQQHGVVLRLGGGDTHENMTEKIKLTSMFHQKNHHIPRYEGVEMDEDS